jgi:hypothetical protein
MKKLLFFSLMALAIQAQAQNVGIGTATPAAAYKLHVHRSEAGADASIGITNSLTTDANLRGARFRMVNSDLYIMNYEATGKLSLSTNFNDRLTIASNGKVGIGVDPASTALLEVNGDTKINGEVNRPSTGAANMVPIAYGMIDGLGVIRNGSGNFTVVRSPIRPLDYLITITGEDYFFTNYTTNATVTDAVPYIISTNSLGGGLIVSIFNLAGTQISAPFSFVTYKP